MMFVVSTDDIIDAQPALLTDFLQKAVATGSLMVIK